MQTVKQMVQEVLNSLPDDCTIEDIGLRLVLVRKANLAMKAIAAGEVYDREQVAALIKSWANDATSALRNKT